MNFPKEGARYDDLSNTVGDEATKLSSETGNEVLSAIKFRIFQFCYSAN